MAKAHIADLSKFHVLCVVSNPRRYESRYRLYDVFAEDMERKGANLWTLELQTGARPMQVTSEGNRHHVQMWTTAISGELWHKENMLNLAMGQLTSRYPDWRYVAWVDADIKFESGVLAETQELLQHHDVVQMWSHAFDFAPDGGSVTDRMQLSYMYCYWNKIEPKSPNGYTVGGHPGYAWAARRDSLNKMGVALGGGPLVDWAILGSADRHMAAAFVGRVESTYHGEVHPNYGAWLKKWELQCERHIRRNVGYVPAVLRSMWHGKKSDRGYSSRWQVLVKHQYNPETDLRRDVSGLWVLNVDSPRQQRLRDDLRRYFISRKEDATTL